NFSNPDTLKTFKDLCELRLEDISKICAEPIKITLSQSEYQKANRILQIALDVMFESVIERIYVPININPNTGSVEV
ncbi:MAG: hypothetical protein ACRCXX_08170, partial [Cetobacterium sp.]|uniref:hypothetical protein n=1 Tax=Cetobacterium sp. TaxID=2071632 RepID=UPI003F3F9E7D